MASVYVESNNVSGLVDSSLPRLQAEAVFVLEGAADLMRALMMILSLNEFGLEMSEKEQ
jgi:hypothetical protein